MPETIEERFWSKVIKYKEQGACWIYVAGKFADGYGHFYANGKHWRY